MMLVMIRSYEQVSFRARKRSIPELLLAPCPAGFIRRAQAQQTRTTTCSLSCDVPEDVEELPAHERQRMQEDKVRPTRASARKRNGPRQALPEQHLPARASAADLDAFSQGGTTILHQRA